MRRRDIRTAAAAALIVLGASACSTPDVGPSPTSSTTRSAAGSAKTSSSTATATASTPTETSAIPEAARQNTGDGALAFTRYFFTEVNQGYSTMNPELIVELSESECQGCAIIKDSIRQWQQQRYHYVGDFVTPSVITLSAFGNDSTAKVLVASDTRESKLLNEANSVVKTFPAEKTTTIVSLRFHVGYWKMSELKAAG